MMLKDKVAVIYGAGGSIGSAVAERFAREGAHVVLTGRTRKKLDAVAKRVAEVGGTADVAVVDATDEKAVDRHAAKVVRTAGGIDISFNLIGRDDVQGVPLLEMSTEDFVRPATAGLTTNFITARAAARHMSKKGSGVILFLDSGSAHGSPMMGGTGPADGAIDTFARNLAAELGPAGIRVAGVWVAGIPETLTPEKVSAINAEMPMDEDGMKALLRNLDNARMTGRSPSLDQVCALAAFLASDDGGAITGAFVNATGGMFTS